VIERPTVCIMDAAPVRCPAQSPVPCRRVCARGRCCFVAPRADTILEKGDLLILVAGDLSADGAPVPPSLLAGRSLRCVLTVRMRSHDEHECEHGEETAPTFCLQDAHRQRRRQEHEDQADAEHRQLLLELAQAAFFGNRFALGRETHCDRGHDSRPRLQRFGRAEDSPHTRERDKVRRLGGDDLGELEQPREQQTADGTDRETDQQPANVAPRAAEESDRVNSR